MTFCNGDCHDKYQFHIFKSLFLFFYREEVMYVRDNKIFINQVVWVRQYRHQIFHQQPSFLENGWHCWYHCPCEKACISIMTNANKANSKVCRKNNHQYKAGDNQGEKKGSWACKIAHQASLKNTKQLSPWCLHLMTGQFINTNIFRKHVAFK